MSEPISWLLLERYALGEVSAEERADVEARLAESAADRACLAQIRADTTQLPPLPVLVAPLAAPATSTRTDTGPGSVTPLRTRPRPRALAFAGALCAAALALIALLQRPAPHDTTTSAPAVPLDEGVKGDGVIVRLLSDRQGASPQTFGAGERFKLELSCPPRLGASLRLFVFQGGQVFEPLPLTAPLACGNLVPWPGAFALDGSEPADVCVSWRREVGDVRSVSDLGGEVSCTHLNTP